MNIDTGREFQHINPQDDPEFYRECPEGFYYDHNGYLIGRQTVDQKKQGMERMIDSYSESGKKSDLYVVSGDRFSLGIKGEMQVIGK